MLLLETPLKDGGSLPHTLAKQLQIGKYLGSHQTLAKSLVTGGVHYVYRAGIVWFKSSNSEKLVVGLWATPTGNVLWKWKQPVFHWAYADKERRIKIKIQEK